MPGTRHQNHPTLKHLIGPVAVPQDVSFGQATQQAFDLWDANHMLIEGTLDQLQVDLDLIEKAATARNLHTVDQVLRDAGQLITDVTGISPGGLAKFTDAKTSDHIHRTRNTLGAVAAANVLSCNGDPTDVLQTLPNLPLRIGGQGRPMCDDEALLVRHVAQAAIHLGQRRLIPAIRYALVEAGAYPSETTALTPQDLDHMRHPTQVALPGVHHFALPRTVDLDAWEQQLLGSVMDRVLDRHSNAASAPIAYHGCDLAGGRVASAAASSTLQALLRRAGLRDKALQPTSILRWRLRRTVQTMSYAKAINIAGRKNFQGLADALNLTVTQLHALQAGKSEDAIG